MLAGFAGGSLAAGWHSVNVTPVFPSALRDLLERQSSPVKYVALMPLARAKRFHTAAAAAALGGYTLLRAEDDHGCEEFIATRGAETLRFHSLAQIDAWVDHLIELRAAGRTGEVHGVAG